MLEFELIKEILKLGPDPIYLCLFYDVNAMAEAYQNLQQTTSSAQARLAAVVESPTVP